jgi:hypothetical protein
MNIWILGGMAAFYAMPIVQLAYEIWRAPLVDDEGQIIEERSTLRSVLNGFRFRPRAG